MTEKPKVPHRFGVIDETTMDLTSPRAIDEGPFTTFGEAMEATAQLVKDGAEECSIVLCRYSKRRECWVERSNTGSINIDARNLDAYTSMSREAFFDEEEEA